MIKALALTITFLSLSFAAFPQQTDKSLLFYLGGENTSADYSASGKVYPNIMENVSVIGDGVYGKALRASFRNAWSYQAPGNIWSERGTVAFWWRSSDLLNETEFPIMRVSYYDHTSWDMVWLRIDWNGHGLDAFVTDNNLARVRVSTTLEKPAEDQWMHIAFSWDESSGVKLYLDGNEIARKDSTVCLRTGLDQLGFHQRIISPYQVQSAYIIQRGGDVDELRIYDHPLTRNEIAAVRDGNYSTVSADSGFDEDGWKRFFGFDKGMPPYLEDAVTTVRKVQIDSCMDYKRWFWKACDGLRETTWPGVYNRSGIAGRNDYFKLPDWDCYSFSGKNVDFIAPEPWNYIEITGGAYGDVRSAGAAFKKEYGTQRSFHLCGEIQPAGDIEFTNEVQETPIQEFNLFNVKAGESPAEAPAKTLSYGLSDFAAMNNPALEEISSGIDSRFRDGERSKLLAVAWNSKPETSLIGAGKSAPVAHVIIPSDSKELDINVPLVADGNGDAVSEFGGKFSTWSQSRGAESPCWDMLHAGLDAIRISLPAMDLRAEKDSLFPMNIAVMDPLSPHRYMFDFSFSVKPGEARTLYLDLRDRILPEGKPLYLRVSGANDSFSAASLQGARIDLIFKDYDEARKEHVTDRLNQVRDNWGTLVEEATTSRRYSKFRQWEGDILDLLKVDPANKVALQYKSFCYPSTDTGYEEPIAPKGVPEWAFLQLKCLEQWKYIAEWYLDHRAAPNGELGGGICDDNTFTEIYPPLAAMGVMPERSREEVLKLMQAVYDNGMQTNGLNTIQTDAWHAFEEGALNLIQAYACAPDEPVVKEKIIEAAHAIIDNYLIDDGKGHLYIASDYLGAGKIAREGTWAWGTNRGGARLMQIPAIAAMGYGDEYSRQAYLKYWDTVYSYAKPSPEKKGLVAPTEINGYTGESRLYDKLAHYIYGLCLKKLSGSDMYIPMFKPIPEQMTKEESVKAYREAVKKASLNEWYNTWGAPYTDRVRHPYKVIEAARLGGQNMLGTLASWNLVSWEWAKEQDAMEVAIYVNFAYDSDDSFSIDFFNTKKRPVKVKMLPMRAEKGTWVVSDGKKSVEKEFVAGQGIDLVIPAGSSRMEFRKKFFTPGEHPRLFFTESAFADLKAQIAAGENDGLIWLHKSMMKIADKKGLDVTPIPYDREKMKRTYNETARKWSTRIISSAYAYRVYGEKKYLDACIRNIESFGHDFPIYTTDFWLENSELCMSFALAYDWLYDVLPEQTKKMMVNSIASVGYDDAEDTKKAWFYDCEHNWNSVCNAALVCAAIATYEEHPERSEAVIKKAINTNRKALKGIYYPDGASPEGPSYWDYATYFECVMMMALEDNFGTDFGLPEAPGFKDGADYRVFAVSNTGRWFSYSDCNSGKAPSCMALWYYAWKFGRTDVLFRDINNPKRKSVSGTRALFMAIACAQRMGNIKASVPEKNMLVCGGSADIAIARSGWNHDDAYLGIKAGRVRVNHAHMDEGSFVFEKDGIMWASEFPHPTYETYRRAEKAGQKFGTFDQFYRGPLTHSVLIVDGKKLNEKGHSVIDSAVDTPERRGATVDFRDCYAGLLSAAKRSVYIVDGDKLEIRDSISALSEKGAHIRWNLVTEADVKIVDDGIVLSKDDKSMKLSTTAPGAVFLRWSANPADYDDIPGLRAMEPDFSSKASVCGFEFDIEAGAVVEVMTKLENI